LAEWAIEMAGVPEWLFEESYHAVGDLAETIALLLPQSGSASDLALHVWVEQKLLPLRMADEADQLAGIREAWSSMDDRQRFVWNKLITGAFRVGVSQQLVTRALAQVSGVDASIIAHRMMGSWDATPEFFNRLIGPQTSETDISR